MAASVTFTPVVTKAQAFLAPTQHFLLRKKGLGFFASEAKEGKAAVDSVYQGWEIRVD